MVASVLLTALLAQAPLEARSSARRVQTHRLRHQADEFGGLGGDAGWAMSLLTATALVTALVAATPVPVIPVSRGRGR